MSVAGWIRVLDSTATVFSTAGGKSARVIFFSAAWTAGTIATPSTNAVMMRHSHALMIVFPDSRSVRECL